MRNSSIWKVIISGALALVGIIIVQGYWMTNSFSQSEKAFEEKVHIALRNVAQQISELKKVQLPSYDLINQISQDYFIVNIRDAIDAKNLEYYLIQEFEQIGLLTDFEYGIYDCDTDQMVYGNYVSPEEKKAINSPSKTLEVPVQNDFVYYFGVRFPDRKGYMLNNQWLPILFTVILCLAVLFFSYATFEILKQKKLSDLQKDFINNMTHEFKTPLSSIRVSSEVFLNHPRIREDDRLHRYAGIINDQAVRLNDQVERVLQIAGMQKGQIQLQKQWIDIRLVIDAIIDQLKSRCEKENASITSTYDGGRFTVHADPHHLSNILYNLVDNALKYRKENATVTIAVAEANGGVRMSIEDNGIGIEKMYLARLHQKFFRVPTGNIHNAKGFGLGLHYVHQMVRMHNWKMEIDSDLGVGTTVTIYIKTP
ncbi:MAG: HAMP domain-containing histidine kinase [Saprospiraceae bacterium]|nr:HAMP domain-containing histidine kinase [Saprospiraceae bacterium]